MNNIDDFENSKVYSKEFITKYRAFKVGYLLAQVSELLEKEGIPEYTMHAAGYDYSIKSSPLGGMTVEEAIENLGIERYISLLARHQLSLEMREEE